MRRLFLSTMCLFLLCASLGVASAADVPKDQRKHTKLGKYVTSAEAYEMWRSKPESVTIVDVRTPEEYDLLGHPAMAVNVPVLLWTGTYDPAKKSYGMAPNPTFVDDMKHRFKPGDTLLVMCRSGHRSAASVNMLADAGFTNAYSVVDGFEGDKEADKASPNFGKRLQEGWRNSKLPWTTDLEDKLVYTQAK